MSSADGDGARTWPENHRPGRRYDGVPRGDMSRAGDIWSPAVKEKGTLSCSHADRALFRGNIGCCAAKMKSPRPTSGGGAWAGISSGRPGCAARRQREPASSRSEAGAADQELTGLATISPGCSIYHDTKRGGVTHLMVRGCSLTTASSQPTLEARKSRVLGRPRPTRVNAHLMNPKASSSKGAVASRPLRDRGRAAARDGQLARPAARCFLVIVSSASMLRHRCACADFPGRRGGPGWCR